MSMTKPAIDRLEAASDATQRYLTMGLAARVAGERYLGWNIDREKHAADLREALGGLKGPIMKVAQILSTIPDALPKEYADELAGLQADAPSMGWFTKRRMAAELGPDWQQNFSNFNRDAVSAASLGQVHKAVGLNNQSLAIKLQYPDMHSAIEADLKQLKLLFQFMSDMTRPFRPTFRRIV